MDFDLTNYDTRKGAESGHEFQLTTPDAGDDMGWFITTLGADSKAYNDQLTKNDRERARRAARSRKVEDLLSPAEQQADRARLLVAVTTDWRGIREGGKALAFSPEAAVNLYTRYPWILEQVDRHVSDRANFLPASSTS